MPNWTENELYIKGPQADRDAFVNKAESHLSGVDMFSGEEYSEVTSLDFNNFVPYPQRFKDQDKKAKAHRQKNPNDWSVKDGFNNGGYEWCCNNWGTKWNACEITRTENKTSLKYRFDTAWSPPIKVVTAMAHVFPALTFTLKYFEGGMGFQGRYTIKGDEIIEDSNKDYHGNRGG